MEADVAELRLLGQKLYLSPIFDLCGGDAVAYALSDSPSLSMVTTMLEQTFAKMPDDADLILRSGQNWRYRHKHYVAMMKEKSVRQGASRKGSP